MGIELEVLVGHPEHELLFVGSQAAKAAGLKDPSASIRNTKRVMHGHLYLSSLYVGFIQKPAKRGQWSLPSDHNCSHH